MMRQAGRYMKVRFGAKLFLQVQLLVTQGSTAEPSSKAALRLPAADSGSANTANDAIANARTGSISYNKDRRRSRLVLESSCWLQVYQELVKKHPSFRERSENVDLSVSVCQ
jgi:hypothetical protein